MITIVGGTYDEFCFEPYWKERYGSGLRACRSIQTLATDMPVSFFTFGDEKAEAFLSQIKAGNSFFDYNVSRISKTIQFVYDHPLRTPQVYPRPDTLEKSQNHIQVKGDQILYFGLLEGSATVHGKKVVYDPQSPVQPLAFSETGSTAQELAYVINISEARKLSQQGDLNEIKTYFFNVEKVAVLVLKMGPKGALVCTREGREEIIPVYKTQNVWPIGSGDVFAACFAYYWFETGDAVQAAGKASWLTACYCNSKSFQSSDIGSDSDIRPMVIDNYPKQQIYLAGPFFTFSERWLIDQVRTVLKEMKLDVFSPWHDVGHGLASEVVSKDLQALDDSGIVFAILDGLDSGTLFEIGYAVHKGIPVVGYVENETSESIKMLEGTNCILEKDLTTAIYKCFWKMAEHE